MINRGFLIKFLTFLALILILFLVFPRIVAPQNEKASAPSLVKLAFNFIANTEHALKGEERDRVNILFLGMPGIPHPAPFLTDTLILLSVKPSTHQLALLSLPRDLLVEIAGTKTATKINALFNINSRDPALVEQTITYITSEQIDYYVAVDLSVIEQVVDTLGGLNVQVPEDINDPRFPGEAGEETFTVQKGWRYFDGKTVQRYLRTRHSDGGDFARMRQQQAVLEALRQKMFGLRLLYDLPTIVSLYKMLAAHIETNLGEAAIKRLYDIAQTISYDKVIQKVADGDPNDPASLLKSKTFTLGGVPAFVLVPKTGDFDYYSIQEMTKNIFD